MMCQEIDAWTFTELVGAFLDLAIAYLLLCGSALAFFALKFLALFGLCLPCPCNGLFGKPNKIHNNKCWQGFLVDCPLEKISNVQFLAKNKFPLDSILANDSNSQWKERVFDNRQAGLDGETSSGSFSQRVIGRDSSMKDGRFDYKGKVVKSQRSRHGIRHRRKGGFVNDKSQSVSPFYPLSSDRQAVLESPGSFSKTGNELSEGSSVHAHLTGERFDDSRGASMEDMITTLESNELSDKNNPIEKDVPLVEVFKCDLQEELGLKVSDVNTIKILEQALEEEHTARSALYLELEKERSAAATAADEAMSMILRLQEEKALIEMESRQYQRMIEEKSAYDAEEMNILKEILLRREREKLFLEKEVEGFRQMLFGSEHFDADVDDTATSRVQKASSYFSEDPLLLLQQISKSVVAKEKINGAIDCPEYDVTSMESQNYTHPLGKGLLIPELDENVDASKQGYRRPSFHKHQHLSRTGDDINHQLQENGMGSVDKNPIDYQNEEQRLTEPSQPNHSTNVHEKTITLAGEKQEQADDISACLGLTSETMKVCDDRKEIIQYSYSNVGKCGKHSRSSVHSTDLCVYGVHVFNDNQGSGHNNEDASKSLTLNTPTKSGGPAIDRSKPEVDMKRSYSDSSSKLSCMGSSRGKSSLADFRRNSMSAFDYERLKIDNEVECLRDRLKIVQEGREKLNFSVGYREREKMQLLLLEDIVSQLREIRQLTEPGKAARQASLPPLSSKVILKKRRSQSISLGTPKST